MSGKIVKMSDKTEELFPTYEAAKIQLLRRVEKLRSEGCAVKENEYEELRFSVTDDTGQYVDDFYVE